MRLYRDRMKYQIQRTVSSYYVDKEDAHFLVRRGLLRLWEEARAAEPLLVGADEVLFDGPRLEYEGSSTRSEDSGSSGSKSVNPRKLLT